MKDLDTQATEYQDNYWSWQKVRDCVAGARAIKARTTTYLPQPCLNDQDANRYTTYLFRAVFYNATARTLDGLSGAVLRKPPKKEFPPLLEYMDEDADGTGCSVDQCAKETLDDVIQIGRAGLLVDFPQVMESPLTLLQEQALNLRASLMQYKAENIINWKTAKIGAETVLRFIILTETRDIVSPDAPLANESEMVYRVLALDEEGFYYQELYVATTSGDVTGFALAQERVYPTYKDGSKLTRIPFVFIGSKNLKPSVDKAPLLDLAVLNLAHYRNSADFEESVFIVGQPTLVLTGLTEDWVTNVWKSKTIQLGSRQAIELPSGGDAKFLQVQESQVCDHAMKRKEEQMVTIGARLVAQNPSGVEAAETIRLRLGGEASILANIADNVSEAYTIQLKEAALFMGANPEDIVYELNDDFFSEEISPEKAKLLMDAWMAGVFAKSDVRDGFRKGEILRAEREDEEIDKEIEEEQAELPPLPETTPPPVQ